MTEYRHRSDYTTRQIRKRPCVRCGAPGYADWGVCALNNRPNIICLKCDVELNEMVVRWAFGSKHDAELMKYRAEKLGASREP